VPVKPHGALAKDANVRRFVDIGLLIVFRGGQSLDERAVAKTSFRKVELNVTDEGVVLCTRGSNAKVGVAAAAAQVGRLNDHSARLVEHSWVCGPVRANSTGLLRQEGDKTIIKQT
jgi:hypothetical protein